MNTDYRYQLESKGWTHNPPNTDLCDLQLKYSPITRPYQSITFPYCAIRMG